MDSSLTERDNWRCQLRRAVTEVLSDAKKIYKGENHGRAEVCLEFISHTLMVQPDVLIPSNLRQEANDIADKHTAAQCLEWSCWIVSHQLRILSQPECKKLWNKCSDFILSLLYATKAKHPFSFSQLIGHLLSTLSELSLSYEGFFGEGGYEHQVSVKTFNKDENQSVVKDLVNPEIVLTSLEECETLQINISEMLGKMALEVCQFCPSLIDYNSNSHGDQLLATLAFQLECGTVLLKQTSISVIVKLFEAGGLPQPQVTDYILQCLLGLLKFLVSTPTGLEGDFKSLEETLVKGLREFKMQLSRPHLHLNLEDVRMALLEGLMSCVSKQGMMEVRCQELRDAVYTLIWQVLSQLDCDLSLLQDLKLQTCRMMLDDVSSSPYSQALVECVAYLLLTDLHEGVPKDKGVPMKEVTIAVDSDEQNKPREVQETHTETLLTRCPMLRSLIQRLQKTTDDILASQEQAADSEKKLFELRALTEIVALCIAYSPAVGKPNMSEMPKTPSKMTQKNAAIAMKGNRFLTPELILKITEAWKVCLQRALLTPVEPDSVNTIYGHIVASIGALLFVQDLITFSPEILQRYTWLLTLHWLPTEMSWVDLKVQDTKDVVSISSALADHLRAEVLGKGLQVMSLLPKEVAGKWRTHVIKQALSDQRAVVQTHCISCFHLFLHHLGPNSNHLVYDTLHALVESDEQSVKTALAEIVGSLACVVSRKTLITRPSISHYGLRGPSGTSLQLCCVACDAPTLSTQTDYMCRERPRFVDPTMFLPFMKVIENCSDLTCKRSFVKSLKRVFGHISIRTNSSSSTSILQNSLVLLGDEDLLVTRTFSEILGQMAAPESSSDMSSCPDEMIISHLHSLAKQAKNTGSDTIMETTLVTLGAIARNSEGNLLMVTVLNLLDSFIGPYTPIQAALAHQQLKQVAAHKGMKMRHLFFKFAKNMCKLLIDRLHEIQRRNSSHDPMRILDSVACVFEFDSGKTFLRRTEPYLLPHLVKKATATASQLIRMFAKQLGDPNHKGPLVRNIRHIYCHLVCYCQDEELMKTFQYLEGESEWTLEAYLRCGQNVDFELALQLGSHYDKVLRGIKIWASKVGHINETDDQITDEHVADLLQPRLLGILVHFDSHLNNGTVSIEEKKQAYNSVISLMKLMGPRHITTVRMRVMTTLKIGLRFKEPGFPELCCKAWNVFVRSVDVSSLGPMLSQIVVNLQPLLHQYAKQVAEIYSYLIVENRTQLDQHFHELYLLPDIPELADVNAIINQHLNLAQSGNDLGKEISQLVKGITHESVDVRHIALTKLKHHLHNNQEALHKLIIGSETADPVISQLLHTLVTGCRESDPAVRSLYGECIGELGAVDPGRLELLRYRPKDDIRKLLVSVTDENFAFDVINELAKAFLRAEDRNTQDCVAFSIQDLITVYGIRDGSGDGHSSSASRSRLWNRFSDEVKEIMAPLMQSKYMLNLSNDWSQLPKPIYRSRKGADFEQWVSTWTGYLISKVTSDKAKRVFEACRGVVKNDHQVALYLLPYVTVQVLLNGSAKDQNELCAEILAVLHHLREPDTRQGSSTDLPHLSAQTVFSVLDHLNKCLRNRLQLLLAKNAAAFRTKCVLPGYKDDVYYKRIDGFIKMIPQELLAYASYNCSAYTRALMHLEQYVKTNPNELHLHLDFLQKLYVALDEPDGVAGVTGIRQTPPSLEEQILAFESVGQLSDASVCYDQAIQINPSELSYRQGLLRCRLALGELQSAIDLANAAISDKPEWSTGLNSYRVEAAWKLGQWEKLETFLSQDTSTRNWNVSLGHILLAAKNRDEEGFIKHVQTLRSNLMGPLSAASMEQGTYYRGYEYITRLHMLAELEQGAYTLLQMTPGMGSESQLDIYSAESLLRFWQERISFTQSSFRTQEPILNLRRILLSLAQDVTELDFSQEIGQCWLQTARVARKGGLLQTVHSTLLRASSHNMPDFSLEKAKWLWQRGDQDKAQTCLEKAIADYFPDRAKFKTDNSQDITQRLICAKMLLLLGRYSEETSRWESNAIVRQYREVTQIHPNWEEGYFYMGQYYDKIMTLLIHPDRPDQKGECIYKVVVNFSLSLRFGNQFIYQSMPRMLSLWLDYGAEVIEQEKRNRAPTTLQGMRNTLSQLNKHMGSFTTKLAPYQFLTASPQLISRICHTHNEVFNILKEMIARVLVHYPQQCVWHLMAVSKSSYQVRARRCQDIYQKAKSIEPNLVKFLQDATKLTDRLLELCNFHTDPTSAFMSISQNFKPLQRLLDDRNFSPIMIPLQSLMTVTLPTVTDKNPFPAPQITIRAIEDQVEILNSLQRPKKVTFKGSDGKLYIMLCKPKDDLRKDARLMEFNGIVNKCLRKDPESRRRDLHINTYSVTPLNEECGMLEWVSNTKGLRNILMNLYQERGLYTTGQELKSMQLPVNADQGKKIEMFRKQLLPRHPAIFSEWFLKTFTDPTTWYNARVAYCRTTAVMSMVGYILGLGDRHGENILLDSSTGECLHVDFNCLFNKGETFDYPEIVPFRLTHNMTEAMGPTKHEGVFRRSCEVTLRVMRDQSDSLMSVLKTFIYDPLVEWSKPARGRSNPTETGEIKNEKAFTHVSNIESRLKGILKQNHSKARGLPLSVEGHVSHLLKEATDEGNLSCMYIGWAAYL